MGAACAAHAAPSKTAEALDRLNFYRAQHGLKPLRMESRLALATRDFAQELMRRNSIELQNVPGGTFLDRVRDAGYPYRQVAHLAARGYATGRAVVDGWIVDARTRDAILSERLEEVGIGYATYGGDSINDHFWVLALARATKQAPLQWRSEILQRVNQFRAQYGLPPLKPNNTLHRAAQDHSDDMAARDYFDHVSPEGRTVGYRVTRAGYKWQTILENLAAGMRTPREVVEGWITSPGHRRAMLEQDVTEAGIGYTFLPNDGGNKQLYHYWTLNLGQPQ